MSQEKLAEKLGVTYQQVQRYERGVNKLNAEKLQQIAEILLIPLSYFFNDSPEGTILEEQTAYLPSDEGMLLNYFRRIKSEEIKQVVLKVAELAAED